MLDGSEMADSRYKKNFHNDNKNGLLKRHIFRSIIRLGSLLLRSPVKLFQNFEAKNNQEANHRPKRALFKWPDEILTTAQLIALSL